MDETYLENKKERSCIRQSIETSGDNSSGEQTAPPGAISDSTYYKKKKER